MMPGKLDAGTHFVGGRLARRNRGLTLLEVLAAFLIFSMVFTVLVGTSQRGVKSQGVSARRLLASEVADRQLADLEAPMSGRSLPGISEEELQEGDFTIRVASRMLSGDDANSRFAAAPDADSSANGEGFAALAAQFPEVSKYLRRYDIEVEWTEGVGTQSVHRTTFAFDWQGATTEYEELFTQGGAAGFVAAVRNPGSAAGDLTGLGTAAGGEDGPGGDRGRGAGASSNSELQRIIAEFCRDNAAAAPQVCGG